MSVLAETSSSETADSSEKLVVRLSNDDILFDLHVACNTHTVRSPAYDIVTYNDTLAKSATAVP